MTRLRTPDHREAFALARRLEHADPASAAEDRRALLLYWYGFGAARLRAEENVLLAAWELHGGAAHPFNAVVRAAHARLASEIASIAEDAVPSAARLRRLGASLAAYLRLQDRELAAVVERTVPAAELADIGRALSASR